MAETHAESQDSGALMGEMDAISREPWWSRTAKYAMKGPVYLPNRQAVLPSEITEHRVIGS